MNQGIETAGAVSTHGGRVRDWQCWAPYAAVAWSLFYAVLGVYWAVRGGWFPYAPGLVSGVTGAAAGRFGPGVAWIFVIAVGLPGDEHRILASRAGARRGPCDVCGRGES